MADDGRKKNFNECSVRSFYSTEGRRVVSTLSAIEERDRIRAKKSNNDQGILYERGHWDIYIRLRTEESRRVESQPSGL